MVQRKVVLNKIGIQADHVKSEKGLVNHHNPSSFDSDLKKKMKKSRSMKKHDFESLRSSTPLRKEIPQPGKPPPPDHVPTRAATPQRQSPTKAPESSPNYMKSTSSFEARKERSQVSSRTPQTPTISKSLSPRKSNNLRHSSGSGNKPIGTLSRTSSLKLVRTLTKTPSFKPARASAKKYSPVVLCENIDVHKPTCSSTLKDSKFPAYLTLSPGATESEGTSAMKVCPYTYCSLNGHHHALVPPLKGFLSAKRRMLKAQKSIKLGCLSPRRVKPSGDSITAANDAEHVIFEEKPLVEEMDLNSTPITPPMQEKQTDIFIEIYSDERLSGTSQCSDIDFEEKLSQNSYCATTEMNIIKFTEEEQTYEAGGEVYPLSMAEEETTLEWLSKQCNSDEDIQPSNQLSQSDSEGSEMEWEAGRYYEPSLQDVPIFKLKGIDHRSSYDESVSKSDESISSGFEDILADEVLVGFYDEESISSDAWFNDDDSELDGSYQNMESNKSILVCNKQSQVATEELTTPEEKDRNWESDETRGKESTRAPIEDPIEEFKAASEDKNGFQDASNEISKIDLQLGVEETKCTSEIEEPLVDHQENESVRDEYASGLLGGEDFKSFHDSMEQDQEGTYNDYNASHNSIEVYLSDSTSESRFSNEISDESKDAEADQEDHKQEIPTADAEDRMEEKEQLLAGNSFVGIRTFESLQDFPDSNQEKIDERKLDDVIKESETNQTLVDDDALPDETQDHSSNKKSPSNDVENQHNSEINQDGAKIYKETNSINSEDHKHSGAARLQSTDKNEEADTMEGGGYTSKFDAEETCSKPKDASSTETIQSNANEEMPLACKNPSWTIRSKRPVEELEESRNFNPREPNYLPVEPDPESEKVDLRHQMMDERKNAEEWMVDFALRQAVTKLAPARKRKVALLVEAFEKVLPTPKYEAHLRHTSAAFIHARTVQACR